jgi:TRAP-type C4-dicarboxylate transport system permease small subunit
LPIIDPNTQNQSPDEPSFTLAHKIQLWLYRIEDGILVGLLCLMILLAVAQIILRNFLGIGIVWADILVRILVLWVGLVGAMAACRKGDHIKIDLISKYLKTKLSWIVSATTDFFTAVVCVIVLFYSIKFVRYEYADGIVAFGRIPVWFCQAIIPFSFMVMSIRYFVRTILNLRAYFNQKA